MVGESDRDGIMVADSDRGGDFDGIMASMSDFGCMNAESWVICDMLGDMNELV